MKAEDVRRLYETWVGRSEGVTLDSVIDKLLSLRKTITPEQMDGKAIDAVKELLGVKGDGSGPIFQYYRGSKQDRKIVTPRQHVPEPIRKLMGEYEDVSLKMLSTGMNLANFVARTRMLTEIYQQGYGKWYVRSEDIGKPGFEKFNIPLPGRSFGPLDGVYVTQETKDFLDDAVTSWESFETALTFAPLKPEVTARYLLRQGWNTIRSAASHEK